MKKLVYESLQEFLHEEEKPAFKGAKPVGITSKDVDSKEFLVGLAVEKEHSSDLKVQETIVLQHLSENPKYYSEGMKRGLFDEVDAINLYKKYFIDKDEFNPAKKEEKSEQ